MPDVFTAKVVEITMPPTRYTITTITVTEKWEGQVRTEDRPRVAEIRDEWRVETIVEEEYGGKKPHTKHFQTRAEAMKLQVGDIAYHF